MHWKALENRYSENNSFTYDVMCGIFNDTDSIKDHCTLGVKLQQMHLPNPVKKSPY